MKLLLFVANKVLYKERVKFARLQLGSRGRRIKPIKEKAPMGKHWGFTEFNAKKLTLNAKRTTGSKPLSRF